MNIANIEDMCYISTYTSSDVCTTLNAIINKGLDKKYYQPKELNEKLKKFKVNFSFNILKQIKRGSNSVKSMD